MKRILLSAAALLATSVLVAACDDDDDPTDPGTTTFSVVLTKAAEIYTPVCAGAGATAAGTAQVVINAANDEITVNNINFAGLSGAVTSSHFHFGPVTEPSGEVVINIGAITSGFDGDFDSGDYAPTGDAPATFAGFITAMKNNQAYINLHTTACPLGEIRGQLIAP